LPREGRTAMDEIEFVSDEELPEYALMVDLPPLVD
jgi:hypothetical protein